MKWLGRLLTGVLIVALVGLTLYAAYRYLVPVWLAVAFYAYLTIGSFNQLGGLIAVLRDLKRPARTRDIFLSSFSKAKARSLILTIRNTVGFIAALVSGLFVWPIDASRGFVLGRRLSRRKEYFDLKEFRINLELQTLEHLYAAYAAAFIGAVYALGLAGVTGNGYGKAFVFMAVASVLLRHIRYAVETQGLPVRLRRVAANPYITYLAIVLCDLSSLVLAFTLLTTGLPPAQIKLENFVTTASGLFTFRDLGRLLFFGAQLSIPQIAVATAGLVFYLGLTRVIVRFKDFGRTDDDYNWLAANNNMLGNFTTAIRFLSNIKTKTNDTQYSHIVSLLGVSQVEAAIDRAKVFLQYSDEVPEKNLVFHVLLGACIAFPIPRHILLVLIEKSINEQVLDAILQDYVSILAADSDWLRMPAVRLVTEQEGRYPLTHAALAILEGCYAEAHELLSRAAPGSELDEIVRLGMLLRVSVLAPSTSDEEAFRAYDEWAQSDLQTIKGLLSGLSHPLEKTIAFGQLAFARFVFSVVANDREQEISYLCNRIKEEVKGNPIAELGVKAIEIRIASLSKIMRAT